jgi:Arylsulfotransferase (ASST)
MTGPGPDRNVAPAGALGAHASGRWHDLAVKLTRRELLVNGLRGGGALVALVGAGYAGYLWPRGRGSVLGSPDTIETYVSRPDLMPPRVTVAPRSGLRSVKTPRQVMIAPRGYASGAPGQQGVMVLGIDGHPQWFRPSTGTPMNLRVQSYQGKPVLTWWEGSILNGYGKGSGYIFDSAYHQVAEVKAGNGLDADLHEFVLTPQGTAIIPAYATARADLAPAGGQGSGDVLDSVVQEVDVASGAVLFEWHSLEHVPLSESYVTPTPSAPFDYFHVNSVDVAPDGDLLVSARNTWAVYKVSRSTGQITWRLHGKRSDFDVGEGARFEWQHDARILDATTISVFDNAATPVQEPQSRGLVLRLDTDAMTVRLQRAYTHPAALLAPNQGSIQVLGDQGAFVGWGAEPYFSQFAADGRQLLDGRLPNNVQSYRAYLQDWVGAPDDKPALAVRPSAVVGSTLYASWNGATQVAEWSVLAGADAGSLKSVARAPRTGFETVISVASTGPVFVVAALDAQGKELGRSSPVSA